MTAADTGSEQTPTDAAEPAEDVFAGNDPKAKFREALARKSAGAGKGGGAHEDADSKIHSAHGPAKAQRSFRRKSGG